MFEDLQPKISRKDLTDTIEKFRDLLKESREYIFDQQQIMDDLKSDYVEVKKDAGRFARCIKDLTDRIVEKDLIDDFSDIEMPE